MRAPRAPHRQAAGQALIEFAILAIVVTLLVAGGVELALAAFAGQRVGDASRAAVDEWARAVGSAGVYDETDGATYEITDSPHGAASALGAGVVGLGDHAGGAFRRPACDPVDPSAYDDGLPLDAVSGEGERSAVYLYNPLPIDVTHCTGSDGSDPGRTRLSVLIDRLPALNRAIYPLTQRRCADAGGMEVSCSDTANAASAHLRLPGKLDVDSDEVGLAMLDGDPASPTFQFPLTDEPVPVFAIECAAAGATQFDLCDTSAEPLGICWEDAQTPLACEVRVLVRFRNLFHALLQYPFVYWNAPLPPEALAQMDVGGGSGSVGSEVARGNVRRLQRTMLGCWETSTTAPGAGMQGRRTTRPCS
jgi:hypothetical protein